MTRIFTYCCCVLVIICGISNIHAQDVNSYASHITDSHAKHQALQQLLPLLQSQEMNTWKSKLSREQLLRRASTAAANTTALDSMLQTILGNDNVQAILKNLMPQLSTVANSKELSDMLQSVLTSITKNETAEQKKQLYSDLMKGNILGLMRDIDPNVLQSVIKSVAANITTGSLPLANTLPGILSNGVNAETIATYAFGFLRSRILSSNSSNMCKQDILNTITGLSKTQTWALKMLDASGKPQPGVMDININWYGSYDECIADSTILDQVHILPSDASIPVVKAQYCTVSIYPPFPESARGLLGIFGGGLIKAGVCAPKSCSQNDLLLLSNQFFASVPIGGQQFYATQVDCVKERPYEAKDIAVITLLGVFGVILVLGTLYDLVNVQYPEYKKRKMDEQSINDTMDPGSIYKLKSFEEKPADVQKETKTEEGVFGKILLSFSIYTNAKKILNTSQPKGTLTAVNGIRFLSMTWVILGHSWSFTATSQYGSNFGPYASVFFKRKSAQAILNALFSVDTFFVLSGLLTSYLTLKQMSKVKGKINWFMFYFHRFWRLTPAYMMLIAFSVGVAHHVVSGPNAPKPDTTCPKYWWWNLLYINNFVDSSSKLCVGWSWYLNNDMQFYVLSPLMIVPLFFKDIIGIISCAVFLLATTITTGALSHHFSWNPSVVGGGEHPGGDVFRDYYIKPYCRMGPYICGIFTGYLLYKFKNKCQLNIFVNLGIWGVATASASAALYGLYDAFNGHPLSNEVSSLYNALSRTVWGAAVSWVIFACGTGNGGPINTLLSWRAIVPLSRLTYCAYLVHPLIIYAYNGSQPQTLYLSDIDLIYKFFGNLVMAYGVAFIFSLCFESPFMGLEKVLFSGISKKK